MPHTPDAVTRFAGIAAEYDAVRPHPPAEIAAVLAQWSGTARPAVIDLGAGSGLSALIWAGRAREVIAVEPGEQMRALAAQRLGARPGPGASPATAAAAAGPTRFTVRPGTAEDTGLPAGAADIVTASQAMHWFDAGRALPEIARILRPGGVFAAYDCDWPPCIDAETDAAYRAFEDQARATEAAGGLSPRRADKQRHLDAIMSSGLFRDGTEIAVHATEQGDAGRLVGVALSQGGTAALLAAGASEEQIGLAALRAVAARRLPGPRTWWWTYRIRMAVRR
ncbi:MAG TPA: class I SAM-dependent methyltransferase [Streptosporangiaceae bacterium]|nr:class I SAM-dependent methyltransferase [Streptosporangiaceae bacterium]